jgi:cytoskeletal protein RodZ
LTETSKRVTAERAFEYCYLDTDSSLNHYSHRQASIKEKNQEKVESGRNAKRLQKKNKRISRESLAAIILVLGWASALAVVIFFIILAAIKEVRM